MEQMYKVVNYETGEVFTGSALPENRSYLCGVYYRKALSIARDNVRCGMLGVGGRHRPHRGVHLYALADGMVAWEVTLS